jgi:hypothetical protein
MTHFFGTSRGARGAIVGAVLGVAMVVASCNDPIGLQSQYSNADQPFTVYALSGTELSAPTAMSFATRSVVRVDGAFAFDLAFDINSAGAAVLLPVGLVGTPVGGAPLIGLLRSSQTYGNLTVAPNGGYVFDSTMVVPAGQAIAIQAQQGICTGYLVPYIFAKITVDSVNRDNRTIHGRTLININCGSRELTPGIPTF